MISILWVSCLYPWLLSALWTSQSYSRSAAYYSFENKLSMSGHWTLESPGHWHQSHHPSGQPPLESRTQSGPGAQTGSLWLSELPCDWVGGVSVTVSDRWHNDEVGVLPQPQCPGWIPGGPWSAWSVSLCPLSVLTASHGLVCSGKWRLISFVWKFSPWFVIWSFVK